MYVGGFVSVSLRNQDKASKESTMIDFARWVLGGLGLPPDGTVVSFELIVEPMKWHFGRLDCYSVMLKPFGYGRTSEEAWACFGAAANMVAQSLARANADQNPELGDPPASVDVRPSVG